MAILVLGGTGFIGPRLIRKLVERGNEVVCMDINPGAADFSHLGEAVRVVRGDVTQFEDIVHAISVAEPDRIINLAYLLGGGEINPHVNMRLNILGMDNCFEAARLLGINRVVYASSIAVSGQQSHFGDRLVDEDDGMFGTSQYATHKIFNEFQAKMYIQNYGLSITGIRPANVTGPDKVRGSTDHVQCITLPARGEPVSFPYQEMMRLPIHVEDIAEVFARVLLVDSSHHPVYNSGGTPLAWVTWRRWCGSSCPTPMSRSTTRAGGNSPATTWWTTAACWRSSKSPTLPSGSGCWKSSTMCGRRRGCRWFRDRPFPAAFRR